MTDKNLINDIREKILAILDESVDTNELSKAFRLLVMIDDKFPDIADNNVKKEMEEEGVQIIKRYVKLEVSSSIQKIVDEIEESTTYLESDQELESPEHEKGYFDGLNFALDCLKDYHENERFTYDMQANSDE